MSSCHSQQQDIAPSKPLPEIKVDGVIIEESKLAAELQYHKNAEFENVVQHAGQALVIKQLLLTKAKAFGIEVNADAEEDALQQLMSEHITYSDPTAEDCERYFENNREKFTTEPLLEVDHILLAAAKDDISGRDAARKNSEVIILQLQQEPNQFAALAAEYSACPSKKTGGSLGQLSKGSTVPEFERQLRLLPEGLADKAIESRYGLHIVKVNRKIEGKALEYSMVEDKVRGYLTHRASHLAIQSFIQGLIEKAEITGIEMKFAEENIHI
jgi:peptidyl-prolyl cis-trans isomerase C